MSSLSEQIPVDIKSRLTNGLSLVRRLASQIQVGKVESKLFGRSLDTLETTFEELLEKQPFWKDNERLARLYTVSRLISASLDLQTVLEKVMDAIIQLTGAERGFLMLMEDGMLNIRVARNFDEETLTEGDITVSRTLTDEVMQTGTAIVTVNARNDPRYAGQTSVIANGLRSIMASPLRRQEQLIGVIYVDNPGQVGAFSNDDLKFLDMFGEQAAIAIGNAVQVELRERMLQAQIEQLKIEIDQTQKERQVAEIVDNEEFQNLRDKAKQLRARRQPRQTSDG